METDKLGIYETELRDKFAAKLQYFRPNEKLLSKEAINEFGLRTDMETVDVNNTIRIWEFKLRADYSAIGQIIVYTNLKRLESHANRQIVGVIAAVEIPEYVEKSINACGLAIEFVKIPRSVSGLKKHLLDSNIKLMIPTE